MIRPRLIPCLLLKHGLIVRSQLFKIHQVIGNPMSTVERFSHWNVDELVILDISRDDFHDLRRDDIQQEYQGSGVIDVLREISKVCFMPLSFGGRIKNLEDIRVRLGAGADKCVINTQAFREPEFITEASRKFGAQCVVVSIDAKRRGNGRHEVMIGGGKVATGWEPADWAARAEELGAGEIFLNSIDNDGLGCGYDLELTKAVTEATRIPVITCGGVGNYQHFPEGITAGGASAVSAANIFHFFELSYPWAKRACLDADLPMRPVKLDSKWFRREPEYPTDDGLKKIESRLELAKQMPPQSGSEAARRYAGERAQPMTWCQRCVYPTLSAVPLEFDDSGVCTGCQVNDAKHQIPDTEWERRRGILTEILEKYRCRDGSAYDCVIPVSGGKDSYFQTHVIKHELGMKPLLVTYNGNNYTDVGWRNLLRMKEAFGVDHVIYSPGVELLKKLNWIGFVLMGDMNWHAHVGITTLPIRIAVQNKTPLLFWGEHGYLDLGGQFSMNDFPEMSYRDRLEHFARGYEWNYFVGMQGITAQDMIPYQYPSDQELYDLDVRGLYLGNYVHWDANQHTQSVIEEYGFEVSDEPFDRTYRRMSNLDDMHENGVHDYLKFVKFGYGRCTDHACKDIRTGRMTRDYAVELVRQYDHVKPSDLKRWLEYAGMTEDEFDRIADTFRDGRVWKYLNGEWSKEHLWEENSATASVHNE